MKIDIFNHLLPARYFDRMLEIAPSHADIGKRVREVPTLYDLDSRFRMMDEFGDDYRQILSMPNPPPEAMAGPDVTPDLVRIGNDGLAELVDKHPDRFAGFTAHLPMNNIEATVAEIERVTGQLGASGVHCFTNVNGKPLDDAEFEPFFDAVAASDLPLWVHPARPSTFPDYATENSSKYEIWWTLGWPYETGAFMARMVFSGLFDRHPDIKIITHHLGGVIPYFDGRVGPGWDQLGARTSDEDLAPVLERLKKRPIDYFKMFYGDTALFGSTHGTICGLAFFGADNVLFASDSPFDPEGGAGYIRDTIAIIDQLDITEDDRNKIYYGNAERLMKLNLP